MLLVSGSLWIVPHGVFQPPRGAQWQFHAAVLAMAAGWRRAEVALLVTVQ
jgi:hypothetical protein